MKGLLEALTIFAKYIPDVTHPTHCEHDELFVMCPQSIVSAADFVRLEQLGFYPQDDESFKSLRYGSA
jgi:hypothetical protein